MNRFLGSIAALLSRIFPPSWTVYKDISYGSSQDEKADLYLLNKGVRPVVIFVHGGGWSSGDKSTYQSRARKYASAGFHVIAINYQLAKFDLRSSQWPAQLQSVQKAIRWVRQNAAAWRIDPSRIGVAGDSAGAQLALMLGTTHDAPNCILDMFGPTDLCMPGFTDFISALPLFGMKTCYKDPALYASASPIKQITAIFPPTMVMHGDKDGTVPYTQSVTLDQRMTQLGIPHKFVTFDGGHALGELPLIEQERLDLMGLWWFMSNM